MCSECGDVYCGAVTVAVCRYVDPESGHEVVQWEQLRYEDAHTPADQMPGLSSVGPFIFDSEQYDEVLRAAALRLDDLAARELQAESAWKQQRRLRARLRRLLPD